MIRSSNVLINYPFVIIMLSTLLGFFSTIVSAQSPPADTVQAATLLKQHRQLLDQKQFQEAFESVQAAQEIYEQAEVWDSYVECYVILARISDELNYQLKDSMALAAVRAARRYLSSEHLFLARALRQRGESQLALGQFDSSIYYLQLAIPIFQAHSEWEDFSWCEILIAIDQLNTGQYKECEQHLAKADTLIQQHQLEETITATMYSIYGVLYNLQGDFEKSIQITLRSLEYFFKKPSLNYADSAHIANSYNNLGSWHDLKGDWHRAMDYQRSALHIFQQLDNVAEEKVIASLGIGISFAKQDRRRDAIAHLKQSLPLIEAIKTYPNYKKHLTTSYIELATAYRQLDELDSAYHYVNQALKYVSPRKRYSPLHLLASLELKEGKIDNAIQLLEEALENYQSNKRAPEYFLVIIYHKMGDAYLAQKDFDRALHYYNLSLSVNGLVDSVAQINELKVFHPRLLLKAQHSLAKTWAKNKQAPNYLSNALVAYERLFLLMDIVRAKIATDGGVLHWSKRFKSVFGEAIDIALQLYQQRKEHQYLELAFSFIEQSKASLLLEALQTVEGKSYGGLPDSLLQQEQQLNLDIAFYERLLIKPKLDSAKAVLYKHYLSSTRLQLANLKEQLQLAHPAYYRLKYGEIAEGISAIQSSLLTESTALVNYFVSPEQAFAMVLTQDSTILLPLASTPQIDTATVAFHRSLTKPELIQENLQQAFQKYNRQSYRLYQLVVEQAIQSLPASINQLIIVPDGQLNIIPFEVLTDQMVSTSSIDFAQLPYLFKKHQFQYAFSTQSLLHNQRRLAQLPSNTQMLALAPSYDNSTVVRVIADTRNANGDLVGTAEEIDAIASYYQGYFDYGELANEARFKDVAPQCGLIHLAMHGKTDFDNPNFAYLQFTNTNTDTHSVEDNRLHHYEISNLSLSAQLVVLSACETGVGQYAQGEGVFSLARSFMYAGVPSIVMSLWKINDQSTSLLMPYFYEQLAKGAAKGTALHQAKQSFLGNAPLKYRHPYYWSGLVLLGDHQVLNEAPNRFLIWIGIIGLAVILGIWIRRRWFN